MRHPCSHVTAPPLLARRRLCYALIVECRWLMLPIASQQRWIGWGHRGVTKGSVVLKEGVMATNDNEAIVAALNELLEAERAGARVALSSVKGLEHENALNPLIHGIHHDESHWCAILAGEIERLGATPSLHCGAFYEKAMAVEDLTERMTFLNRGQSWVVRKIDALLPTVNDETLRAHLTEMRDGHVENIARTDQALVA